MSDGKKEGQNYDLFYCYIYIYIYLLVLVYNIVYLVIISLSRIRCYIVTYNICSTCILLY